MYCAGLNLAVLARFQDHQGFDGVMLGSPGMDYHFEFTHCGEHPVTPSPAVEDLLVFYVPDQEEWQATCDRLIEHGFICVRSLNPYWDVSGRSKILTVTGSFCKMRCGVTDARIRQVCAFGWSA
jgi:hypothetical protein